MHALPRLALLMLAFLVAPVRADAPKPADTTPETIEQLGAAIGKILTDSKTPGVSLAIVDRNGVVFAGGFGVAHVAQATPVRADTRFRIGSTSKNFTALAALKLVREGRLDLNAKLADLAPDIAFENPWEATDPVRIVHLLEHTSGFDDIHLRDYANQDARPNNLVAALAHDPDSRVSRWRPGTRVSYCNAGPAVVARVIERITGEVFEDYVQREWFDTIGMRSASYFRDDAPPGGLTELYREDGQTPYDYWHISMRPAGSINASAEDMAAYLRFLLGRGSVDGRELLDAATFARMEQPQTSLAAREGLTLGYGLYNYSMISKEGFLFHGHNGGVLGGASELAYSHDLGAGYAFMINATNGSAYADLGKLLRRYVARGQPAPALPAVQPLADDLRARYAGWYVPNAPRMQSMAWLERIAGVGRLQFDGDAVQFGALLGETQRYVGAGGRLLRRDDQAYPSLILIEAEDDGTTVAADYASFRKLSLPAALAPLVITVLSLLLIVSVLLFLPVWLFRRWRGRIDVRGSWGLRLWPLASSLGIVAFLVLLVLQMVDPDIFAHYGAPTARALLLSASSVLAALLPWPGLWLALRHPGGHRGLLWHARLVLASHAAFALVLIVFGVVPYVTWG